MIRLFKHYIPHAVLLLGMIDVALLMLAGDLAWRYRAEQIGTGMGDFDLRLQPMAAFAAIILIAMIAVGVYGAEALRSLRFASARLLVAVSLGIIALAGVNAVLGGDEFWRSTLFYGMWAAIGLLLMNRLVVGGMLGTSAFRRRVLVLGAGERAQRHSQPQAPCRKSGRFRGGAGAGGAAQRAAAQGPAADQDGGRACQ